MSSGSVTVITPTVPERAHMLKNCIVSVEAQTHPAEAHLIGVDLHRKGPSFIRNDLLKAVQTEWVQFLDDDDILYPQHLELLLAKAQQTQADLVYGWCEMRGRSPWIANEPIRDINELYSRNWIPVTALCRWSKLEEVGFFTEAWGCEDHDLWIKLLRKGARFACVEQITWAYIAHGTNRSGIGGSYQP